MNILSETNSLAVMWNESSASQQRMRRDSYTDLLVWVAECWVFLIIWDQHCLCVNPISVPTVKYLRQAHLIKKRVYLAQGSEGQEQDARVKSSWHNGITLAGALMEARKQLGAGSLKSTCSPET